MHSARRGAEAEMPIDYRVHRSPLSRRPNPYAAPFIWGAALRRLHLLHPRPRYARDEPRAALEGDVAPAPAQRDSEAVAEPDQEVDVGEAPQQPRRKSRELDAAELRHRAFAPDGRHGAEVAITERRQGPAV